VVVNSTPAHADAPDLSTILQDGGYQTFYTGKWHVTGKDVRDLFTVLHGGSWWGEITDQEVTASARSFLRSYEDPEPFFLSVGYLNPHDICITPLIDKSRIDKEDESARAWLMESGEFEPEDPEAYAAAHGYDSREPAVLRLNKRGGKTPFDLDMWQLHMDNYLRFIEMVDLEIDLLLQELERSPWRDNTLVIFTSDHGEGMGRHQYLGKGVPYEESLKVPLIISSLGDILDVPKNAMDDKHLVSGIDFARTVCDYAGIEGSEIPHGRSLRQLVEAGQTDGDPVEDWREYVFAESMVYMHALRGQRYKYIREYIEEETVLGVPPSYKTHSMGVEQLFDLEVDPNEQHNLAYDVEYQPLLRDLRMVMNEKEDERLPLKEITHSKGRDYMERVNTQIRKRNIPVYYPVNYPDDYTNVLLIMTDQHTFSALGASGNKQISTPNLDRLAQEGAFFTHCITPTPYCSPTRASVFTGLSTNRHGIWNNVDMNAGLPGLDEGVFPITEEILYDQGYHALHWGKLHVCNNNTRPKDYLTEPWHCNTDFACYESWPFQISAKRDAKLAELNEAAYNRGFPSWSSWDSKKNVIRIPVITQASSSYVSDIGLSPVPAMYTREFAFGQELMEAMNLYRDQPWMFTLSYHPPHEPWNAPEPYYGMYDPDSLHMPDNLHLPDNQEVVFSDALAPVASVAGGREIGEKGRREFLRTYYAQVTMIDDMVGEVLDHLDELGLRERTLIVFTADHGDMAGSHAAVGKNLTAFFEPLVRVPMIVSFEGKIPGGIVVDELVTPMDIMPTILDYAGYSELIPEGIDGSSIRPLIEGGAVDWRNHVIGMRDYPTPDNPNTQYMIRTGKWKYWWNYREGLDPHMYDLEADPLEKHNLAGNPDYHEQQMELHNKLTGWVKENQARQHEVMEYMESTLGLEPIPMPHPVELFPNPAGEAFTLRFQSEGPGAVRIQILDAKGRLLSTDQMNGNSQEVLEYSGSTAGMNDGAYLVRIETDSYVAVRKLLVSNQPTNV